MRKRLSLLLLLLLCLTLCACAARETPAVTPEPSPAAAPEPTAEPRPEPTPEPTAEPTPVPTPEPTPEPTPCPHRQWSGGVCADCGAICSHPAHKAESRICAVCGEPVPHNYVGGLCTRCGEAPVFETQAVPRELFTPCEHGGTVEMLSYTTRDPRSDDPEARIEKQMAVYLPCGYDPAERYDVLVLLHGLYGSERYWLAQLQDYRDPWGDYVSTVNLLDHMIESGACRPMIVAAPTFYRNSVNYYDYYRAQDQAAFTLELREDILPALAEAYATWAESATGEGVAAAREHFAYAGLSMGSMYAYTSVIPECLDLFAWFGCFSGSDGFMPDLAERLNSPPESELPIRCFYNSIGTGDEFYALHRNQYLDLVWRCKGLSEGENAWFTTLDSLGHWYAAWSLGLYNFLPLLFAE